MHRGRFAPSPTGPLHLGSLLSALASCLDARSAGGAWLVRIEDLDPPREPPGAAQCILESLRAHGLEPDEPVLWQSRRHAAYDEAIARLLAAGAAFYCTCSRQELSVSGGRHASHCPQGARRPAEPAAIRVPAPREARTFDDLLLGSVRPGPGEEPDAFVIRRKDGFYAYHLAVVVDDAFQRITRVVRGRDLLDCTPHHLELQRLLGLPHPEYAHLPLLCNAAGQKLSKQNLAPALDDSRSTQNLRACLDALRQPAPPAHLGGRELVAWSTRHWDIRRVPTQDLRVA